VPTHAGAEITAESVGDFHWSSLAGICFWVDPQGKLVAICTDAGAGAACLLPTALSQAGVRSAGLVCLIEKHLLLPLFIGRRRDFAKR